MEGKGREVGGKGKGGGGREENGRTKKGGACEKYEAKYLKVASQPLVEMNRTQVNSGFFVRRNWFKDYIQTKSNAL